MDQVTAGNVPVGYVTRFLICTLVHPRFGPVRFFTRPQLLGVALDCRAIPIDQDKGTEALNCAVEQMLKTQSLSRA